MLKRHIILKIFLDKLLKILYNICRMKIGKMVEVDHRVPVRRGL